MAQANPISIIESRQVADDRELPISLQFAAEGLHTTISNVSIYSDYVEGQIAPELISKLANRSGKLHFGLMGKTWSRYTQGIEENYPPSKQTNIRFQLSKQSRPQPNSRIARRWSTSALHPVAAVVRTPLRAGQAYICEVVDISIGGAHLEFSVDPGLFVGQQTQIEIDYPLAAENSTQTIEIVSLENSNGTICARVRFTPITSVHINSLANHLIKFQFSVPLSALELDLENTTFPKSRIEILEVEGESHSELSATIEGEEIVALRITSENNGKRLCMKPAHLSDSWPIRDQISCLMPSLLREIAPRRSCQELVFLEDIEDLWFLGFRKNKKKHWVMPTDFGKMSDFRAHQINCSKECLGSRIAPKTGAQRAYEFYESIKPKSKMKVVSWDQYGLVYDKMCEANSSYQALLSEYRSWVSTQHTPIRTALDLGAGTGNFVAEAARQLPFAKIEHIDQDTIMNFFAQEKYANSGIENVRITTTGVEALDIEEEQYDLITAIHSIYTLSNPKQILENVFRWLKPGGLFYVVDIGRTIDTNEWLKHILVDCVKSRGLKQTALDFWDARSAVTQNKKIQATQDSGKYWNRSHEEFLAALRNIGFEITHSKITYRGNSDLAICRKPSALANAEA